MFSLELFSELNNIPLEELCKILFSDEKNIEQLKNTKIFEHTTLLSHCFIENHRALSSFARQYSLSPARYTQELKRENLYSFFELFRSSDTLDTDKLLYTVFDKDILSKNYKITPPTVMSNRQKLGVSKAEHDKCLIDRVSDNVLKVFQENRFSVSDISKITNLSKDKLVPVLSEYPKRGKRTRLSNLQLLKYKKDFFFSEGIFS